MFGTQNRSQADFTRNSADLMHGVPLEISSLSNLYIEKGSREERCGSTLRLLPRTGELDMPCIKGTKSSIPQRDKKWPLYGRVNTGENW